MKPLNLIQRVFVVGLVVVMQVICVQSFAQEKTPQMEASAEPNEAPAKIVFEQPIHDFGPVAPGSSNTCEFKFKNKGTGTLKIEKISKTCGCTVFELEKMEYAPGEEGTLKVKFNADKGVGVRTRHLYIFSNDRDNPRAELTIKAAIVKKVTYEPDRLSFAIKGEKSNVAELTILSTDDKPFAITSFNSTADAVIAEFDATKNASKFVLQTKIDTKKMGANTNGRIEIHVTHPECSSITVPFSIVPNLRVDPPAINILNAEPGKPEKKELWVLSNYDENFEISSIESREGIIKVADKEKDGNRYKINLEIMPPLPRGNARMFTDTLSISTKDGEQVKIACRGFYKQK